MNEQISAVLRKRHIPKALLAVLRAGFLENDPEVIVPLLEGKVIPPGQSIDFCLWQKWEKKGEKK